MIFDYSLAAVVAAGLLQRMFDQFIHEPAMAALVLRARRAGVRTGLLSNSWGNEYPREGWDQMFDAVVISGEVGMRKPEPEIYRHVLELLGVRPEETVFVDDLQPRMDNFLKRLQEKIESFRADLDARAARGNAPDGPPAGELPPSAPPPPPPSDQP